MERILVARAPVRISFGGGGTDLPSFYERAGGFVVSATINYYVYAILTPTDLSDIQVTYAEPRGTHQPPVPADLFWDNDLSLPKAVVYHFNICSGMTVFLASQVPPGAGLGLSGSVAVSMIKALAFCCGLDLGPREVAELACYIEIEKMGMPVGKQDPYAAAFGGLNSISFDKSGVVVEPLKLSLETRRGLEEGILLFFASSSRQSAAILQRQHQASREKDPATLHRLEAIKQLGLEMRSALERAEMERFGRLLHRSWIEKRQLVEGITNPSLDRFYEVARDNGAIGGKVTGAGGGGFLMLYCPTERQAAVTEALGALGLRRWSFSLEEDGVQIMQVIPWSREPLATPPIWSQPELLQRSSFIS